MPFVLASTDDPTSSLAVTAVASPTWRTRPRAASAEPWAVPIVTLVLWTGCLAIGVIGALLPYPPERPPRAEPPAVTATLLEVEFTDAALPSVDSALPSAPEIASPPALPEMSRIPPTPALVPVAQPSPTIAFELPVTGPTRVVPAEAASVSRAASATKTASTETVSGPAAETMTGGAPGGRGVLPTPLTLGQGEGRQPAPEYPRQAARERQEGVVVVQFTVGEDGRVLQAEAATPCRWPLLNAAAVRTVRDRWRFRAGPTRFYQVPIRFELTKS